MVAPDLIALARHGPAAAAEVAQKMALEPQEEDMVSIPPAGSDDKSTNERMMPDPPDLLSILHLPPSTRDPILQEALNAYPNYVSPDLAILDEFRYKTTPAALQFQGRVVSKHLTKYDLKTLMDWKLGHGQNRPALRGLIEKNDEKFVRDVTARGFKLLQEKPEDIRAQLKVLQELKGVGPATASLILSCADPEGTVFFGDEVYEWVCPMPGEPIKYTVKEYVKLWESVREIKGKLGLSAVEIEKIGYVFGKRLKEGGPDKVMVVKIDKEQDGQADATESGEKQKENGGENGKAETKAKGKKADESGKRKANDLDDGEQEKENAEASGEKQGGKKQVESRKKAKVKESVSGTRKSTRSKKIWTK